MVFRVVGMVFDARLKPGSVIILDNSSFHKDQKSTETPNPTDAAPFSCHPTARTKTKSKNRGQT